MRALLYIICFLSAPVAQSQRYFDSFITDTLFRTAHMGVSIYDPVTKKYVHGYQSDKYFVPASNTKIFTCYAAMKYLPDTISILAEDTWWRELGPGWAWTDDEELVNYFPQATFLDSGVVWTGPTDSLLRPMMFNSDNYLAEHLFRELHNRNIDVDSIAANAFSGKQLKPKWVDGCGLSRYNLFTPLQFTAILEKLYNEFGMQRIRRVFPTGGTGTLKHYYLADKNIVFAKTGSLTGVIGLSGYIFRGSKPLIFSILINNYIGSGLAARRRIERFIHELRAY